MASKTRFSPSEGFVDAEDSDTVPFTRVAVVGPTRRIRALLEWTRVLAARGHVVFSPTLWKVGAGQNHRGLTDTISTSEFVEMLRCADAVFVIDLDEIDSECNRAIERLSHEGMNIRRLSWEYPHWTESDCEYLSAEELRALPAPR